MVTAGVYLLTRLSAIFLISPVAMTIVAVIGLFTALLAASIALAQNDIKKILAYSTVSQLGFMFLACGVGAFGAAMFHVVTHAFFKALLFLGSGSVIHAMSGEQDVRKMGGLWKKLPITGWTMAIGTAAISGIPLLAGFWSKDEILLNAFAAKSQGGLGGPLYWIVAFFTAGLTAFYMTRMMVKTFAGAPRYDEHVASHLHESPISMTLPLVVLAALSIVGGFMNAAPLGIHAFAHWLEPVVKGARADRALPGDPLDGGVWSDGADRLRLDLLRLPQQSQWRVRAKKTSREPTVRDGGEPLGDRFSGSSRCSKTKAPISLAGCAASSIIGERTVRSTVSCAAFVRWAKVSRDGRAVTFAPTR